MPVCDEIITIIFILQLYPVFKSPEVISKMYFTIRHHDAIHSFFAHSVSLSISKSYISIYIL